MNVKRRNKKCSDVTSVVADSYEEALQVFFERMKLAEIDSPEELKQLFDETDYYIVQEVRL